MAVRARGLAIRAESATADSQPIQNFIDMPIQKTLCNNVCPKSTITMMI
jgi:hypothetical protein